LESNNACWLSISAFYLAAALTTFYQYQFYADPVVNYIFFNFCVDDFFAAKFAKQY
jgi:hypothetical protein